MHNHNELSLGGLTNYLPIIQMLPVQQRIILQESLDNLRKIGVQEYGRRIIYSNGYSQIITTCERWVEAFNSNSLKTSMISHMSNEVLQVKRNNFTLITRSPDKIDNEYLKALDYLGLNNSIIKYHFFKNYIEISYFVADKGDNVARDIFFNKIALLEEIEKKILPSFIKIQASSTFNEEKELLLCQSAVDILFQKSFKKSLRSGDFIENTLPHIDYKDLSYLAYLAFECSNKYIAKAFCISESTVKLDISNLKVKLKAENRDELVEFANTSKIKQLVKVMNII